MQEAVKLSGKITVVDCLTSSAVTILNEGGIFYHIMCISKKSNVSK